MIGYYNVSVILTYLGLFSAIYGMTEALRGDPKISLICLMICGLCDMFDGSIARKCKRTDDEKMFGIQIDSLCDLVCFGVFPAMLGYGLKEIEVNSFDIFASAFYVLAAVIRLGYFNVSEINRTTVSNQKREYYEGLPVTSVSLLLPVIFLIGVFYERFIPIKIYSIALVLIATAFISRFKIKKPYMRGLVVGAFLGLVVFLLIIKEGDKITYATSSLFNLMGPMLA